MDADIVVGMSGGVDSTISAICLKEKGYRPVGVFLRLPVWQNRCSESTESEPDTQNIERVQALCQQLDIPFHILDVRDSFHAEVISYMKADLSKGFTPNPCVVCNRNLKFARLIRWAQEQGISSVATGHYARIDYDETKNEFHLFKSKDPTKDQSYGLAYLTQDQLSKIVLPLEQIGKEEVYTMADKFGLSHFKEQQESQDFCYLAGSEYNAFVKDTLDPTPGDIVTLNGETIGTHKGLAFYTLGQKKGLNLPRRYYVIRKEINTNRLVVSESYDDLLQTHVQLYATNINCTLDSTTFKADIVLRYHQDPISCSVTLNGDIASILLDRAVGPITPGQFGVLYQGDQCIGGGIITPVSK